MDKITFSTLPGCSDQIRQELAPTLVTACRNATQAEGADHVHFESLEAFSDHLKEHVGQHVVLYDTAQSVVCTAYEEGKYDDEILSDWLEKIGPVLALYKKNRRRMSFAAGQSFLEGPHARLKFFLEKLHLPVDEKRFDPDLFVLSDRRKITVWSKLLADYAVLHEPDLRRKITELEVGSITSRSASPDPAAAYAEIKGYKDRIATLTDRLEKQQVQAAEFESKIDASARKASEAERARQETERQCDVLNAKNELLSRQLSSTTEELQQLFVKSETQRHAGAELSNKQAELDNKQAELDAFFASRSWRVTAPMRAISRMLRIR